MQGRGLAVLLLRSTTHAHAVVAVPGDCSAALCARFGSLFKVVLAVLAVLVSSLQETATATATAAGTATYVVPTVDPYAVCHGVVHLAIAPCFH